MLDETIVDCILSVLSVSLLPSQLSQARLSVRSLLLVGREGLHNGRTVTYDWCREPQTAHPQRQNRNHNSRAEQSLAGQLAQRPVIKTLNTGANSWLGGPWETQCSKYYLLITLSGNSMESNSTLSSINTSSLLSSVLNSFFFSFFQRHQILVSE